MRGNFTYQAVGTLTLRNVRITGQRLIWEECTEEWCTHYLTPPYIWPGQVDYTLIDHHPVANPSDPYYEAFISPGRYSVFFEVVDSLMVIENCTIDNIRVRADSFITLKQASLIIADTNIINMDFGAYFISGEAQNVRFTGLYVAGFNRDHAFVRSYNIFDSGFLQLSVKNITLTSSLFENNIQLSLDTYEKNLFKISEYLSVTFEACVFRNSMHSFSFANSLFSDFSSLVVRKCRFEGDFNLYPSFYMWVKDWVKGEVRIVDSLFSHITSQAESLLLFSMSEVASVITIVGTTFTNNQAYTVDPPQDFSYPYKLYTMTAETVSIENSAFEVFTGETQSFMEIFISKGLINNSTDLYESFSIRKFSACASVLYFASWADVRLHNVSFTENNVCSAVVLFSTTIHTTLQVNMKQISIKTAGGIRFAPIHNIKFHCEISSSTFENTLESVIALNDLKGPSIELIVTDCEFASRGIVFSGTSLEIMNSRFADILSQYGALEVMIGYMNQDESIMNLLIDNSSFANNQGEFAADIGVLSDYMFTSLNLSIHGCNFSHFSGISGGSIYIDEQWLNSAVIDSCIFTEGSVTTENGVIVTSHSKGILHLDNVIFDSIYIPNSYVIQVASSSIPSLDMQTETSLTRVTIQNCTYQVAVSLTGKYWLTWLHTYKCRFSGNHGITVRSALGLWKDVESLIEYNTAEDYPCYFQVEHSLSDFQGTQFLHNSANSGSCIYLKGQDSTGVFTDCLFQGNTANYSGGVMRIEQWPTIAITASRFIANAAPSASVLQLIDAQNCVSLVDSVLQENKGNGVIVMSRSSLTLKRSSLLANSAMETAGVILIHSSLFAFEVSFSTQIGVRRCLLDASSSSSVNLTNCQVAHFTCIENIIEVTSSSTLAVSHSIFTDLISTKRSVIWVEDGLLQADYFSIERISVEQAFLSTIRTNVSIQSSHWRGLRGRGVQADTGEFFTLVQSEIRDVITGERGTMLQCRGIERIGLAEVTVRNVTGGAGVRLQAVQVQVKGCVFRQVHGREAGALWVDSTDFEVSDSVFLHNGVLVKNSVGAAVRFSANNTQIHNCIFTLNTATSGAAIFYSFASLRLLNTTFSANQALYAPDIASYPARLHPFNLSTVVVASGQPFIASIVVGILDSSNQLVKTDRISRAWLVGKELTGKLEADKQDGLFSFSNFTVTSSPGQIVNLTVVCAALEPITLRIQVRSCLLGEIRLGQTCVTCPPSTYSVDSNHSSCSICPSDGRCPGDGQLYPDAGYWRPFESYNGLLKCPNQRACLGHSNYSSQIGVCAEMYEGHLCQSCVLGASRSQPDQCALCPGAKANKVIVACAAGGVFILITGLVRSALHSAQRRASNVGVLLKILLNYTQMMVIVNKFNLNWPDQLQNVFNIHQFVGSSGEQYLSLDCMLNHPFYDKILGIALLPLVLIAVNMMCWGLFWAIKRTHRRVTEELICSIIVSLFYFHLYITTIALSSFDCLDIPPGHAWLRAELSSKCWNERHVTYSLAAALPTALLWGGGIPALALLLLVRYRKYLRKGRKRLMLGFLCVGYKKPLYFWEIIIIVRKACIATLHTFMSSISSSMQGLVLIVLLYVAAQLQYSFSPFLLDSLNRMEFLSIVVTLLTAYVGLYFSIGPFTPAAQYALGALVIFIHFCFLLYTVKTLYQVSLKHYVDWLRRKSQPTCTQHMQELRLQCKHAYLNRLAHQTQLFT